MLLRQDRAISTAQLKACGISAKVITRLRKEGWLHHKHYGVWSVGTPRLSPRGRFWAGHLATGGTISYRSASVVHALRASFWKVELTLPHYKPDRDGLKLHEGRLPAAQITDLDGLPVTTLERTLLDLADVLTPRKLEIAINQAEINEKLDYSALEAVLLDANGRHGITPLRHALEAAALGLTLTESELEEAFLALTRKHRFQQPETRFNAEGFRCDFVWPDQRIVIETDGARFHRRLRNREEDARRDRTLRRVGWTVDRVSYRQVFFRPQEVVVILEESGVPRAPSPPRRRAGPRRRRAA